MALQPRLCPVPPRKANRAAIPLQTKGLGALSSSAHPCPPQSSRRFQHSCCGTMSCQRDRLQLRPPQTALPWRSVLQPHPSWSPGTQQVSPTSSHVSHPSCPFLHGVASLRGPSWTLRSSCCHTSPLFRGSIHPCFCWTALPRFAWQLQ